MNAVIREILYTEEYKAYYNSLAARVQTKYDYVEQIIRTQYIVSEKFIKHLGDTDFYEARVSVGTNEYRTILFAIETRSFYGKQKGVVLELISKKGQQAIQKGNKNRRRNFGKIHKGGRTMIRLDENKLAGLTTSSDHLDEKYGKTGSQSREEFEAKAEAWYYAELLKCERKRQKMTQQELGDKIGMKREYISSLEQGKTDMQLSTFVLIANALGLRFSLVVG